MEALFPWWIAIKLIFCMLFYITPDAFNIDTSLCDNEEHQNCRLLWPFMHGLSMDHNQSYTSKTVILEALKYTLE